MTKKEAIELLEDLDGAIEDNQGRDYDEAFRIAIKALSAEVVSREEYEETDGVVTIEKQNANEVGEIKHIVIRSPNYTKYFYNESMPTSAEAVQGDECDHCVYKWGMKGGENK